MDRHDEKQEEKPLLYKLLGRTVLFLMLFLSAMLLFYFIGNYQEFLDRSQTLILTIATVTAIMLVFFAAAGLTLSLVLLLRKKTNNRRMYGILTAGMSLALVYGAVFMVVTRIINLLSAGI